MASLKALATGSNGNADLIALSCPHSGAQRATHRKFVYVPRLPYTWPAASSGEGSLLLADRSGKEPTEVTPHCSTFFRGVSKQVRKEKPLKIVQIKARCYFVPIAITYLFSFSLQHDCRKN